MFTPDEREGLRAGLIEAARADGRLSGVALTGSAAGGPQDEWSDIDLAFGVRPDSDFQRTLADWTATMYEGHGALHHVDVVVGATVYRVFLLASTLQVDLAFSPEAEFGPRAPTFRLVSGRSVDRPHVPPPTAESLIGLAWLYALHARSSIARGRWWQAEYMIGEVRDHVLALACLRHGLPSREGRGIDRLPAEVLNPLEESLVRGLDAADLARAFEGVTAGLLAEMGRVDAALAERLRPALTELNETVRQGGADGSR